MYGDKEAPTWKAGARHSVIGSVERSNHGNIVLRVGQLHHYDEERKQPSGWEQTEHVVLTPSELRDLVREATIVGVRPSPGADVVVKIYPAAAWHGGETFTGRVDRWQGDTLYLRVKAVTYDFDLLDVQSIEYVDRVPEPVHTTAMPR